MDTDGLKHIVLLRGLERPHGITSICLPNDGDETLTTNTYTSETTSIIDVTHPFDNKSDGNIIAGMLYISLSVVYHLSVVY